MSVFFAKQVYQKPLRSGLWPSENNESLRFSLRYTGIAFFGRRKLLGRYCLDCSCLVLIVYSQDQIFSVMIKFSHKIVCSFKNSSSIRENLHGNEFLIHDEQLRHPPPFFMPNSWFKMQVACFQRPPARSLAIYFFFRFMIRWRKFENVPLSIFLLSYNIRKCKTHFIFLRGSF